VGNKGIKKEKLRDELDKSYFEYVLKFLKEIDYIEVQKDENKNKLYFKIPFFEEDNISIVWQCFNHLYPIIKQWLDTNIPQIQQEIKTLNSVKNKVSFREIIIQVWHFIFGHTNRYLAEAGFITDTYKKSSHHIGYLPAISHHTVVEVAVEKLINKI
jgi:hypothetical protein